MKTRMVRRAAKIALITGLALGALVGAATWYGNREVPPPTLAEHQASYQRAVAWMHANEALILKDANSALWWMVETAAERTGDEYLKSLTRRSLDRVYGKTTPAPAWKRMVEPKAEVALDVGSLRYLEPYQRFFYHALTCLPVPLEEGGDTTDFLQQGRCRPVPTQVYMRDSVCSTHQLMGVQLFQRTGCATPGELSKLQTALVADIGEQMRWDNVLMKDAYIQRVLMLYWVGGPDQVRPSWMRRVLNAQQADGGWVGARHVPELPDWLQPWKLQLKAPPTNFHATAQGLLLAALAIAAEKPR